MTEAQATQLAQAIHNRSRDTERRIIALRQDGQAGFALVAPDSIMLSHVFFDGAWIHDAHMN